MAHAPSKSATANRQSSPADRPTSSKPIQPAKILEIGPFPPPYTGWSTRIKFVKEAIEAEGHVCTVLNLGKHRRIPSPDYECVRSGWEYLRKVLAFSLRGYRIHMHINGDSIKGLVLALIAGMSALVARHRPALTFHAGTNQTFFPKRQSRILAPIFKFLFHISQTIICNNEHVKVCIVEYGINADKIVSIPAFSRQYLDTPLTPQTPETEQFLSRHTPLVLTYIECRSEYALPSLFEAIARVAADFPRLGLLIVGAADGRHIIQSYLAESGLEHRSLHIGILDHGRFLGLLRQVTVFLRSASTEGTSTSVREALYQQTPVVASCSTGHPEGVITYSWNDSHSMSRALSTVLTDHENIQKAIVPPVVEDTLAVEVNLLLTGKPQRS